MASGWAGDGAVQDQIDSTIDDAVARARRELPRGESNKFCDECGEPIPEARRQAIPGVRYCVKCQQEKAKATNFVMNAESRFRRPVDRPSQGSDTA